MTTIIDLAQAPLHLGIGTNIVVIGGSHALLQHILRQQSAAREYWLTLTSILDTIGHIVTGTLAELDETWRGLVTAHSDHSRIH